MGVALSGGGHRASLFTLGALLYLVDSGLNKHVSAISSVSGGSIANGFVAQECDFPTVTPEKFDRVAGQLATAIVKQGLLNARLVSWVFGGTLAVFGLLAVGSLSRWSGDLVPGWLSLVFVGVFGILATQRGTLVEYLFGWVLFRKGAHYTTLGDIRANSAHVFCATDLNYGGPCQFVSGSNAYCFSPARDVHGRFEADEIPLRAVVRASAAFPGAFPPKRLRLGSKLAFLADGGVWNNLGTQWWGLDSPPIEREYMRTYVPPHAVERLLIVDASVALNPASSRWYSFPLVNEVLSLSRSMNVLYPNSVKPRVEALRTWLDTWADGENTHLGPAVVALADPLGGFSIRHCREAAVICARRATARERGELVDPVDPPDANAPLTRREAMHRRAVGFLETLDVWRMAQSFLGFKSLERLHARACAVPTTLSRVDRNAAVALMAYGYLASMEALHVTFGAPMLQPPNGRRLLDLVGADNDPRSASELGIGPAAARPARLKHL